MKITIETYGKKYTAEFAEDNHISDFLEEFRCLLGCVYEKENIDEYFRE